MKLRHGILAGLMLLGLAASPAFAADKGGSELLDQLPAASKASPWSGIYMGLHGGYGIGTTSLTAGKLSLDGLSSEGFVGGIHGGLDYQFANTPIVARVRAAYTWGNVEFNVTPIFSAAVREGWSADVGLGYDMGRVMPYVFAGYTEAATSASAGGKSLSSPDLEGIRYGGGVEWKLPNVSNLTLALDYTYTDYSELSFGKGALVVDPDDHRIMARINFRVGG